MKDQPLPQDPQTVAKLEMGPNTILLVEDEEAVKRVIYLLLSRNGYRVLSASSGDEALVLCRQHQGPIHLLLTDLHMPNMNGTELARRVLQQYPKVKIICISGELEPLARHPDRGQFCTHFLNKPFRSDVLLDKIREVLEA